MSFQLFLKAALIWFVIALFAVLNGLFRESVLLPYVGETMALSISGITLSIIVFSITYLSFGLFGKHGTLTYLFIGIEWVFMTLIFEFIFGHYVMEISWSELLEVFNILKGDLFILVLCVSLLSPLLVSRIKK